MTQFMFRLCKCCEITRVEFVNCAVSEEYLCEMVMDDVR